MAGGRLGALFAGMAGGRAIALLGVSQIVSWGCVYYAIAVQVPAIAAETGWSKSFILGGISLALLAAGLASPAVGRAIDRHGGARIMAAGSILAALGMAGLGLADTRPTYYLAWALIGVAQAMTLYEAAFSTLAQLHGERARRAITLLTFLGGFASTVFWPVTLWLGVLLGWRETYFVYAGLQLALCLPLHLALPRPAPRPAADAANAAPEPAPPARAVTGREFWLLAAALALSGFVLSAMSFHLIVLLQGLGFAAAAAVLVGSIIGPAQVGGRVAEFAFGQKAHPLSVGVVALAALPLGLALLALAGPVLAVAIAFAVLHGVAQGLNTIVRGAVPLSLFGAAGYAVVTGRLAAPTLLFKAAAPLAFAWIVEASSVLTALWIAAAIALAGLVAMMLLRFGRTRS
jgi:MFS family permease